VSHVEAVDISRFLLSGLAHALLFFFQGAISYMVTILLTLEASDESLLWLMLHLGGFGSFVVLSRYVTFALGRCTVASWHFCVLDRLHFFNLSLIFCHCWTCDLVDGVW
jgi:hypothetical protein